MDSLQKAPKATPSGMLCQCLGRCERCDVEAEAQGWPLVLATDGQLMSLTCRGFMLVDYEVYRARIVYSNLMHVGVVGWASNREWAGE